MPIKELSANDVFYNTIETNPRFEFKIWGGEVYLNSGYGGSTLSGPSINPSCGDVNILDFSCPEVSYDYAII